MTQHIQPYSLYTVQAGNTLSGIAQQAYGDNSEAAWRRIYNVNQQVMSDPNRLSPGELIYIPSLQSSRTLCNVIVDTLNVRTAPTSQSSLVASYPRGTVLNYVDIILGEAVGNLPLWGYSDQGHYFWLGGTDYSTPGQVGFAATVGSSGNPVNRDTEAAGNLTTIRSPGDRPVAKFTQTTLNVPPLAKGVVYIQSDSDNPQTLVSNTPNAFASFTIAPNTSTSLLFRRVGTFQAYLNGYPLSADTTLTIIITMPYPD
jgi:LysM domain-containing protein